MLLSLSAALPLSGLEVSKVHVFGGMYWQGNADPEGAPSPLKPVWGAEVPLILSPLISVNPSLSFPSPIDYTLSSAGLAIPTEIETANAVTVFQLILDARLAFNFRVGQTVTLSPFFSPAFMFFIPTFGYGEGRADYADPVTGETGVYRSELTASLYSSFRIFRPSVGANVEWRFSEAFGFFGGAAIYFPMFHAWDSLSLPFYDGLLIALRLGFTVHIK